MEIIHHILRIHGQCIMLYCAPGEANLSIGSVFVCLFSNRPNRRPPTFLQRAVTYLTQLLENPEQSGTQAFDQQRYTTAAKECLKLCLCSYRHFSKGATESGHRDRALCQNKPSAWIAQMGVHCRIWKGRHHLRVLPKQSTIPIRQHICFPDNSPKHEYYRSVSYRWALDLLPLFLENSVISLELAEVLHKHTFTTMAQQFSQRRRLAKEVIAKYLFQVESVAGNSWINVDEWRCQYRTSTPSTTTIPFHLYRLLFQNMITCSNSTVQWNLCPQVTQQGCCTYSTTTEIGWGYLPGRSAN